MTQPALSPVLHFAAARATIAALGGAHFIGGRSVATADSGRAEVLNPASGEVLGEVSHGGGEAVDLAVRAARRALPAWRGLPPAERATILHGVADVIDANADVLAEVESLNVGKPLSVSRSELPLAADALRFMAGAARALQAPASGEYAAGHVSMIRRQPVGVVGAITPWNYPLMMAIWKIAPALAAGNTVVLKPSELTPFSTLLLADLTADILPAGTLNIVLGTGSTVGRTLAGHPSIDMVSLTGSVGSGRSVAAAASHSLKRLHLELGGKAPVVVFADADLDAVADTISVMGYWNSGQECGSATRVLCHANVYDDLLERVASRVEKIQVGDPAEGEHIEMGPLISAQQLERVQVMVDSAERDGATVVAGGSMIDRGGSYFAPTLIADVRSGQPITREEIFGPVVTIERFTDEAEAITSANDVEYGLAASVWTEDVRRSLRVTDALDFGTVWVNSHLTLISEMPWGGYGSSGYGRDMSTLALDDYTRTKHVMIAK